MKIKEYITYLLICIFIVFSFTCGKANAKVIYLNQNSLAPYSGYLFDPETQNQAQIAVRQLDEYRKLVETDKKIIQEYKNQQDSNSTLNIVYFLGGALAGGILVEALHK